MSGRPTPIHDEFDITDRQREEVDALIEKVSEALQTSGEKRRNVVLAALAELSVQYLMRAATTKPRKHGEKGRKAS